MAIYDIMHMIFIYPKLFIYFVILLLIDVVSNCAPRQNLIDGDKCSESIECYNKCCCNINRNYRFGPLILEDVVCASDCQNGACI